MESNKKDIELEDVGHFRSKEEVRARFKEIKKFTEYSEVFSTIRGAITSSEGATKLLNHSPNEDKKTQISHFLSDVWACTNLHDLSILISPKYRKNFCTDADDGVIDVKKFEQALCDRRFYFKSSAEGYLNQLENTLLAALKKQKLIDLDKTIDKFEQIQSIKTLGKE